MFLAPKIYKSYVLIALSLLAAIPYKALAVSPGFYAGFMAGPARAGKSNNKDITVKNSNSQIGARLFTGYKFSRFIGLEGGISYYSSLTNAENEEENSAEKTTKNSRGSFDIVGQGLIPISDSFDIYAKAGIAATTAAKTNTINPSVDGTCNQSIGGITFCPTMSVGADYNITPSWVVDVSWNQIRFSSKSNIKSQNFYALGISYHFVDIYCGQFLC